nr:hypothetical protein [Tanacetum cinerariifolium]
ALFAALLALGLALGVALLAAQARLVGSAVAVDGARLAGLVIGEAGLAVFAELPVFAYFVAGLIRAVLAVPVFAGFAAVAVFPV